MNAGQYEGLMTALGNLMKGIEAIRDRLSAQDAWHCRTHNQPYGECANANTDGIPCAAAPAHRSHYGATANCEIHGDACAGDPAPHNADDVARDQCANGMSDGWGHLGGPNCTHSEDAPRTGWPFDREGPAPVPVKRK